jgi:hypothetical protein
MKTTVWAGILLIAGQDETPGAWKRFKAGDRFLLRWTFEEKFRFGVDGNETTRNDRREVEAEMIAEKDGRELKINPTSVKWTYAKTNTGGGEGWEVRLVMDEPGQVREDQVKWLTAADFPKAVQDLDRLKEKDRQRVLDMLKKFEEGNKKAAEGWAAKLKKEMTRQHGFRTGMSHSRVMPHSWGTDSVNSLFDWAFFHDQAPAGGFKDGAEWEQDLDSQENPRYASSIWVEEEKRPKKIKMTCRESGGDLVGAGSLAWDYSGTVEADKRNFIPERKITAKHAVERGWSFAQEGYLRSSKITASQESRADCADALFRQTLTVSWAQDLQIERK